MQENNFSLYTQLVVDEAKARGIEVISFPEFDKNWALLKFGNHTEFISQSSSKNLSHVVEKITQNKPATLRILRENNIPVPEEIVTDTEQDILEFLKRFKKIVIKPVNSIGGNGITAGIVDQETVKDAFNHALKSNKENVKKVICQEFLPGDDNRVLVIDGRILYAVKREPARVMGDGKSTIKELIEDWNLDIQANRKIKMDERLNNYLSASNRSLQTIPLKDETVRLSNVSNAHMGGISTDVTDTVSLEVVEIAKKIANIFKIGVIGIDFITQDISNSIGKVTEVEGIPGLSIHTNPTFGTPRFPQKDIIDSLFPETVK